MIYVDNCLLIGDKKAIKQAISDIKATSFKLKEDRSLEDYLSCEVTIDYQERKGWIHQPHLIKKIETNFRELVSKCQKYATPDTPRTVLVKAEETLVSKEEESIYRSGTGQLLYLVKHSRRD